MKFLYLIDKKWNFQEFSFHDQWGDKHKSYFTVFLGFLQVYSSIQAFVVPEVLYSKTSQYTAGDSLYIRSTSCHSRYDLYQVDNCLTKIMTNICRGCHWNYLRVYWKFPMMLIQNSGNYDWLFNTQSKVLQVDWLMLENNAKATLNINMPYWLSIKCMSKTLNKWVKHW